MKTKFFLIAISLIIALGINAQKGIDTGTPFGSGEDSVRCRMHISLFIPYANSKNYKDAYPSWRIVYDECPASNINIYIIGVNIINWQISQETDPAKKEALVNEMMKLYDDRIKYFSNDRRGGKDYILALKAQTYNQLKGDNTDHTLIIKWLGEAISEFKEKTNPLAVSLYMFSSFKLMQDNMDKYKAQYVSDFLKCSEIFDAQLAAAKAANNEKEAEELEIRKKEIEQNFTASGAADCETLHNIYAPKVDENKKNLDFLKEIMKVLYRVGCHESDVYLTASEYAYKIEPTAESAMGLGKKAYKENDYTTAEKYLNEAIGMSDNAETKADLYYVLAAIANQKGQNQNVKQLAMKCLAENPNYGKAYILIALAYASGGKNLFPDDPVLSKCVYYAVVDKLEKARQVDPALAAEANKLISTYNKYYPTKEEVFMHPSLEAGENFHVPGWVNETVKVR